MAKQVPSYLVEHYITETDKRTGKPVLHRAKARDYVDTRPGHEGEIVSRRQAEGLTEIQRKPIQPSPAEKPRFRKKEEHLEFGKNQYTAYRFTTVAEALNYAKVKGIPADDKVLFVGRGRLRPKSPSPPKGRQKLGYRSLSGFEMVGEMEKGRETVVKQTLEKQNSYFERLDYIEMRVVE